MKKIHKNIPRKIAGKLDGRGVGIIEKKKVLGVFPSYTFTFEQKEFVENRKKAFQIVLDKYGEQKELEAEEEKIVVLMSLVYVSNLIRVIFLDKSEAKQIKKISKQLPVSKAVQSTIDSINMTIMASINSTQ